MAVYKLRKIQLGKETTWGTAVTPTVELRGLNDAEGELNPAVETKEEVGRFTASIIKQRIPEATLSFEMDVSYQHVLYPLVMAFGEPTPSGSGPYTWTFNAPYSSPSSPKSFTARYGMPTAEVYTIPGLIANKIVITGRANEDVTLQFDGLARTMATATGFETLTEEDVEYIAIGDGKFYLDAWNGTMKTTAVNGTLIEFELSIDLARHTKCFISANTQPEAFGEDAWEIGLRMVYEWNSYSKALFDSLLTSLVQRQICVSFGKGTGASERLFEIQMPAILTDTVTLFSDRDGNATVEMNWKALYHATLGTQLKIVVKNNKSTL